MSDPAESDKTNRFASMQQAESNEAMELPVSSENLFDFVETEGKRWNKVYPYQLLVVEKTTSGWKKASIGLQFTLPIPPQTLNLEMPFAITTSATLGGVIEEHNGAPFRMIQFSGTTGVLPLRGAAATVSEFKLPQAIFAGSVVAASALSNGLVNSGLVPNNNSNLVPKNEFDNPNSLISKTSGYYQYHLLRLFFENYANIKKTKDGKNLRLAFAMWKDKSVYLVTPVTFRTVRDASSPHEYRYDIALKAWARITLDASIEPTEYSPLGRDPNKIAKALSTLSGAREALENYRKVLEAMRADIENALYTPLREIALCLKAISGAATTLVDLPGNIIEDCKDSILSYFPTEIKQEPELFIDYPEILAQFTKLSVESGKAAVGSASIDYKKITQNASNPINKIFAKPFDYSRLFAKMNPGKMRLPPKVQKKINAEQNRVLKFTRKDFETKRDSVLSVLTDFCDSVGLGATTYNNIYNVSERGSSVTKTATESDYEIIFNLNAALIELNRLVVSNKIDPEQTNAVEYIAGLAKESGITFTQPVSKFLVPYPYGHTLEQVALMYLGDANRWHEIATLNGLREPFIDEVGFDLYLSTNGVSNSIQIADVSNLFVGQFVHISSSTEKPEKRKITGIDKISGPVNIVYLSGDSDLDRFTLTAQSKIHAYLPDTINSQMSIYIPSDQDVDEEDFQVKSIPGVDYFDSLVRSGGISLLLSQNNDILITSSGSTRLAVGLTNIVQKARIALSTPRGSLLQHPGYGLPVYVGSSTADISAKDILKSIQDMFRKDPTFSDVTSAFVVKSGPVSKITVSVGIAGTNQNIPITADIRR